MVQWRAMATPESAARLVIRPAQEDDAAALREIFNEAVQDGLTTFEGHPRPLDQQKQLIRSAQREARHPLLVADLRGWTLGWITIQRFDAEPNSSEIGEVSVYVRRSFRNYGVGRQLMRAIQKEAQNLGYRKLIGHVLSENQDSLRLCRAAGWREVGRLEQHARHERVFKDVTLVEYLVPPAESTQTS